MQFGRDLGFDDARALVPYLHDLGISDVYASPLFASREGTSGYHVVDPTRLDPGLGSREDFDRLTAELRRHRMGLLLDIVPNHMAASSENPWWRDVLKHGRGSRFARFFDIDWKAEEGRVVVPVLGAPPEDVLRSGELDLDTSGPEPVLRYHEHLFPIDPDTYWPGAGPAELLGPQHYRLVDWREAGRRINYRRFFDISDLVALRAEDREVFAATHALVLDLIREGTVTGLRIDHVDGLRDPLGYLRRLQDTVIASTGGPLYVVVEKILAEGETLPPEWPVAGTTGYDFIPAVTGLFTDPRGLSRLRRVAGQRGGGKPFPDLAVEKKRQVIKELFGGELRALSARLVALAGADPGTSGVDEEAAAEAIAALSAELPVYRTYVREPEVGPRDRRYIAAAASGAARRAHRRKWSALSFLRRVLLLDGPSDPDAWLEFVLRWQQFTGPVAAKGVEDTALYADPAFLAQNEVGSTPGALPMSVEDFHRFNVVRQKQWPHGLSATSTHDTKRSEDARMRITVLSETADRWAERVMRWRSWNASRKENVRGRPVPDDAEELFLYQTFCALWDAPGEDGRGMAKRLQEHAVKAAREGKAHTSWIDPDPDYERALTAFVREAVSPANVRFRKALTRCVQELTAAAAIRSLSQVLLKIVSPGVPDFYQGTEMWNFRLVDPDNRRPVDFRRREVRLRQVARGLDPVDLLGNWSNDRLKLLVTARALAVRAAHPRLFAEGSYVALRARGTRAAHVVALARRLEGDWAIAVVPRSLASVAVPSRPPVGRVWSETRVVLPADAPRAWADVLTGAEIEAGPSGLDLSVLLASFPLALLAKKGMSRGLGGLSKGTLQ